MRKNVINKPNVKTNDETPKDDSLHLSEDEVIRDKEESDDKKFELLLTKLIVLLF